MGASWSIITVTRNSADALQKFASRDVPSHVEWIVIDNASNDASAALAREFGASTVVSLEKNVGFSAACNIGLGLASAEYVAFVNPDVTVNFEDLPLFTGVLAEADVLLAPQLKYPDGRLQANGRGVPLLVHKVIGRLSEALGIAIGYYIYCRDSSMFRVSWVTGASVLGRRSTFESLNGWDERFFVYYEDADLCIRAVKTGVPTYIFGGATWVHGWSRATKSLNFGAWRNEIKSLLTFYATYPRFLVPGLRKRVER